MHGKLRLGAVIGACVLMVASLCQTIYADEFERRRGDIRHVLLISVDGFHSLDFANCANGINGFKGGGTYCPNLKALAQHGVNYLNSSTSKPSDSFPGLMAIISGGSPRTVGAFYDVAFLSRREWLATPREKRAGRPVQHFKRTGRLTDASLAPSRTKGTGAEAVDVIAEAEVLAVTSLSLLG